MNEFEKKRQVLQSVIDNSKTIEERRKFGQFSTPYNLAKEIMAYGLNLKPQKNIQFLEPAVGTGVFLSVLNECINTNSKIIDETLGVELDSSYFEAANSLWKNCNIQNVDFTDLKPTKKYNLLISNPPYVRHHLISSDKKIELTKKVEIDLHIKTSGLMGLYCYFILLAHKWLAEKAVSGWLIPSEFMDVNYGIVLKKYLLNEVHLTRIHRYTPTESKFDDALVSSCVVWFVNEKISHDYEIEFSYGNTIDNPLLIKKIKKSELEKESKWTRFPEKDVRVFNENNITLGDFFEIKRGIATGDNDFFILTKNEILDRGFILDENCFQPILPSPRNLRTDRIIGDEKGIPIIDTQYFLLNCSSIIDDSRIKKYLDSGKLTTGAKYICKNRKVWYQQEKRTPTKFLCSYMGRGTKSNSVPFRFIFNDSQAIATNSYLMLYPKKELQIFLDTNSSNAALVWEALKQISVLDFSDEQRVYGGGLKKIEPRELAKVKCRDLGNLLHCIA